MLHRLTASVNHLRKNEYHSSASDVVLFVLDALPFQEPEQIALGISSGIAGTTESSHLYPMIGLVYFEDAI